MTPLKLPRKHRNRLLTYAKGLQSILEGNLSMVQNTPILEDKALDHLHDALMRAYAEGWTHGEAAQRESGKSQI